MNVNNYNNTAIKPNNNNNNFNNNVSANTKNNLEQITSEENIPHKNNNTSANNFVSNENKSISKNTLLNNTEDYVIKGKNISGITNEMINQLEPNNTINGNKINESKFFLIKT